MTLAVSKGAVASEIRFEDFGELFLHKFLGQVTLTPVDLTSAFGDPEIKTGPCVVGYDCLETRMGR